MKIQALSPHLCIPEAMIPAKDIACVTGQLNMGMQQSHGNLVFRGRERTQRRYFMVDS
jgi:hypothetical protein